MFMKMSISKKISTVGGILFLLFIVAIIITVRATYALHEQFNNLHSKELVLANAINEIYAQGLQQGQAIRNIILDPTNPQAYKNFDKASQAFDKEFSTVENMMYHDELKILVQSITPIRLIQKENLNVIMQLAKSNQTEAIKLLNQKETPAWRKIKKIILDLKEKEKKYLEQEERETNNKIKNSYILIISSFLMALFVGTFLLILLRRSILDPLGGELQYAVDVVQEIASGHLNINIQTEPGDKESLLAQMKRMQKNIYAIVSSINQNTELLTVASKDLTEYSERVGLSSQTQTDAAQVVSSNIEEMAISINQVAESATHARDLSTQSMEISEQGTQVIMEALDKINQIADSVKETAHAIEEFETHSDEITKIVNVIKSIADQTNLLALNASIEAARAGENGRGFAVVADDVRELAEKTARATLEISKTIDKVRQSTQQTTVSMLADLDQVEEGLQCAQKASAVITNVKTSISQIVDIVNRISLALREQSQVSNTVTRRVQKISFMSEENNKAMHDATQSARQVDQLSTQLQSMVKKFTI